MQITIIEQSRRMTMNPVAASARSGLSGLRAGAFDNGQPRNRPPDEVAEDDDNLDLPVEPDEGTPLIPDDERVVDIPS